MPVEAASGLIVASLSPTRVESADHRCSGERHDRSMTRRRRILSIGLSAEIRSHSGRFMFETVYHSMHLSGNEVFRFQDPVAGCSIKSGCGDVRGYYGATSVYSDRSSWCRLFHSFLLVWKLGTLVSAHAIHVIAFYSVASGI